MNPDRSAVQAGTTSEASVGRNTDVKHGVCMEFYLELKGYVRTDELGLTNGTSVHTISAEHLSL